jgi:hypothetical protein
MGDVEEEERRCRVCFDEEEEDGNRFISPCKCQGSQKHVHEKCLRRWQRSVQLQRQNAAREADEQRHIVCNVCKSTFDVLPPSRMQILEELSGMSPADVKPGVLLVATDSHQVPFSPDMPGHWQALFEARRAHWVRGVYLLCSVAGDGETGVGDQVIGVNLTRAIESEDRQGAYSVNVREEALAARADGDGLSLAFYIGGPVASRIGHAIGLVTAEGAAAARAFDVSVVRVGENGDALVFGKTRAVMACATEYGAVRKGNVEYAVDPSAPNSSRAGPEEREQVHVCVYQGHATWSRQQLMGEITRGSWGVIDISDTHLFELHNPDAAAQQRVRDRAAPPMRAEIGKRLWESLSSSAAVKFALPNAMQEEFLRGRSALSRADGTRAQGDDSAADARQVASAAVAAAAAVGEEGGGDDGGEGAAAAASAAGVPRIEQDVGRWYHRLDPEHAAAAAAAAAAADAAAEVAAAAVAAAAAAADREAEVDSLQEAVAAAAALAAADREAAALAAAPAAREHQGRRR